MAYATRYLLGLLALISYSQLWAQDDVTLALRHAQSRLAVHQAVTEMIITRHSLAQGAYRRMQDLCAVRRIEAITHTDYMNLRSAREAEQFVRATLTFDPRIKAAKRVILA